MTEEEKSRGSEGDSTNHGLPHWSEPATEIGRAHV